MKQNINPKLAIALVVGVLIIVACTAVTVWRAPSAGPMNQKALSRAEMDKAMREAHQGPTPEQMKKIQEWRQKNPGGYTRN